MGYGNNAPSSSYPGSFEIGAQNQNQYGQNYNELTSNSNSFEISEIEVYQVNVL